MKEKKWWLNWKWETGLKQRKRKGKGRGMEVRKGVRSEEAETYIIHSGKEIKNKHNSYRSQHPVYGLFE